VRAEAARCAAGTDVPWRLLRRVCQAVREERAADATPGDADAAPGACTRCALTQRCVESLNLPVAEPWLQTLARSGGLQLLPPQRCVCARGRRAPGGADALLAPAAEHAASHWSTA
jgi:hypothetical protein